MAMTVDQGALDVTTRALAEGLTPDEARRVGQVVGEELVGTDGSVRAFLLLLIGSAWALRRAERDSGGSIRSFGDALWCSFSAMSTVGESGCPPVSPWGRLCVGMLELTGGPLYRNVQERVARIVERLSGGGGRQLSAPKFDPSFDSSVSPMRHDGMEQLSSRLSSLQGLLENFAARQAEHERVLKTVVEQTAGSNDVDRVLEKLDGVVQQLADLTESSLKSPEPVSATPPVPPTPTVPTTPPKPPKPPVVAEPPVETKPPSLPKPVRAEHAPVGAIELDDSILVIDCDGGSAPAKSSTSEKEPKGAAISKRKAKRLRPKSSRKR